MILVTGAHTYLGQEVAKQLTQAGHSCKLLHTSDSDKTGKLADNALIEWVHASLLDVTEIYDAVQGVQTVFHCDIINEWTPEQKATRWKYNSDGTANLVNVMLHHGVENLIFFSSMRTLSVEADKVIHEKSKMEKDDYTTEEAMGVMMAEREVWRGGEEGLNVAVINTGDILIPSLDGHHLYAQASKKIQSGRVYSYPAAIHYVWIEDVAELGIKVYLAQDWRKRFLAVGVTSQTSTFYQDLANILGENIQLSTTRKAYIYLYAAWDRIKSTLTGRARTYRRKYGLGLLHPISMDASITTAQYDMQWKSLKDVELPVE